MKQSLLLKLANKQQKVYVPPRSVPFLAQVKAQQVHVPLNMLLHGSMTDVMNTLTNNLINGKILTKTANIPTWDFIGAINDFALNHVISPQKPEFKRLKALFSPYGMRLGYKGACDAFALARSIVDPNVIKGLGENVLSMNKYLNLFNIKNVGSLGRYGGGKAK